MRSRIAVLLLAAVAQACSSDPAASGASADRATFTHIHLDVADPEFSKRLWVDLFDGELAEREGYIAIRLPGALVFLREEEPAAPSTETALDHIGLQVRDLDALLGEWRALGYGPAGVSSSDDGRRRANLRMPNGTAVELEEAPELPAKAAFDHVHFHSANNEAQFAWYRDLFGAASSEADSGHPVAIIPPARLIFTSSSDDRAPTEGSAIDHIGFEVDDIEAFTAMLHDRGLDFTAGPFSVESLGISVAFLPDPAGVLVEVSEGLSDY